MALHLQKVPSELNILASRLSHDADIQKQIQGISARAVEAADAYKQTLDNKGGNVLVQKSHLLTSVSPNDVKITNLKSSLHAVTDALQLNKQAVINLQTDIHINIESCRGRKIKHDSDLSTNRSQISDIISNIESLDENIKSTEEEALSSETGAAALEGKRDDINRAAKRKKRRARIGGIAGAVLAPFTGGISLGLATVYAGVNLNDAGDCDRHAKRLREEANSKREHVNRLRVQKGTFEEQKLALENEIASLQTSSDQLSQASQVLKEVTDFLRRSIVDIDDVLIVFQDMDNALAETLLQTNSFTIIQNAFEKQPSQLDFLAQKYLDMLKSKWVQLETTITEHSTRSILN